MIGELVDNKVVITITTQEATELLIGIDLSEYTDESLHDLRDLITEVLEDVK